MQQILVVEDDVRIQRALVRQFAAEGYQIHVESDGLTGLKVCKSLRPAAVVLDLMLPGLSGRSVCKEIKAWNVETPVIILSAVNDVADKVLLLELGADDYVTKPFSPRELLARVQAAIRRNHRAPLNPPRRFGNIAVDFSKMELQKRGVAVAVTAHEFKLLRYFLEHTDRAISREELLQEVWGASLHVTTRTVDNQILKLRQKLEDDPSHPDFFRTVHGIGYRFVLES